MCDIIDGGVVDIRNKRGGGRGGVVCLPVIHIDVEQKYDGIQFLIT